MNETSVVARLSWSLFQSVVSPQCGILTKPDDITERQQSVSEMLFESPRLLSSWHRFMDKRTAYAFYLLHNSWKLSPPLSQDLIPHKPVLRIWDDATGWNDNEPMSLTVYRGLDIEPCFVRYVQWQLGNSAEHLRRMEAFVNSDGDIEPDEPKFLIRDAPASFLDIRQTLERISECAVPAVTLQPIEHHSVSTDVGVSGFEYFSQDQPPARLHFQWSVDPPDTWAPIIDHVRSLQSLLLGCIEAHKEE